MIRGKTISLIIPCKNEEFALGELLPKIPSYVDEVIVVDNNSSDNSALVAKKHKAIVVKELRTEGGIGYGYAHQSGIAKATGDYVVALDGDDTYPVEGIKDIITHMNKNKIDFISCNRLPLKKPNAISKTRQLGIRLLNMEIALLYGYAFNDVLTGMWVMNRKAVALLRLSSGDWNLSIEIKLEALTKKAITFGEYHIDHFERMKEESKQHIWKTGMDHAFYILYRRMTVDNPLRSLRTIPSLRSKFHTFRMGLASILVLLVTYFITKK